MIKRVRIPKDERIKFETRACTFFPREIEDYLLGEITKLGTMRIHMVLPTRQDDIDSSTTDGVTLQVSACDRARATARELGLKVLGSVHTHPYKRWNGYGVTLSQTDYRNWDAGGLWYSREFIDTPVIAICAIYRRGITPDRFSCFWRYWLKNQSVGVSWDDSDPFVRPEIRTL